MSPFTKGLDIDAAKKRLETLKKTKKSSDLTWKPTEKEQTIRIVPYKYQPQNPFVELYFHYNLNGKTYLSPISFGEPDPIMEVAQKLKNTGDKDDWKQGKQLEPKLRTYAPVIVRGREAEGVKFWGFGKTIYEDLLSNITDPECGNITDPANGRDIVVHIVKEEGKDFASPKMRIKMTQSPITEDRDILTKIIKEQPDIREIYEIKSYEELEQVLDKYLHPDKYGDETNKSQSEPENDNVVATSNAVDNSNPPKDSPKEEIKSSKTLTPTNIEDAFTELFEENKKISN